MEKVCKNCEYFVQISSVSGKYVWGDCREPSMKEMNLDKEDVFKWADRTCPNFKPKQAGESTGHRDSRSR